MSFIRGTTQNQRQSDYRCTLSADNVRYPKQVLYFFKGSGIHLVILPIPTCRRLSEKMA